MNRCWRSPRRIGRWVLRSTVLPQPPWALQASQVHLVETRVSGQQVARRDHLRLDEVVVQQTSKQPQRRLCASPAMNHEIQILALVSGGATQLSADPPDQIVQAPAQRRSRALTLRMPRDQELEFDRPAAEGLMASPRELAPFVRANWFFRPLRNADNVVL